VNAHLLRLRCVAIAKEIAPKDKGNLAFNSIRSFPTPTGFRIVSLGNVAPYNIFLERGTKFSKQHVGWWSRAVKVAVFRYVDDYYNDNLNSDTSDFNELAKKSKNNDQRTELFNKSIPKR
jgi:hypothetical protein